MIEKYFNFFFDCEKFELLIIYKIKNNSYEKRCRPSGLTFKMS